MKCCTTLSSDTHELFLWTVADPVVDASLVWRSTVQAPSTHVQNSREVRDVMQAQITINYLFHYSKQFDAKYGILKTRITLLSKVRNGDEVKLVLC